MAKLAFYESRTVEEFLDMGSGYVLDFSDRTFREIIGSIVNIDIDDPKYKTSGTSKAKRLRSFIESESDYTVGKLFKGLHTYKIKEYGRREIKVNDIDATDFVKIADRLLEGKIIEHIDAIQANNEDKDFHQLAKLIKESIEKNEPETALDRLHLFLIKFLKELCSSHGVTYDQDELVNSLYGKYVKAIREKGFITSEMTDKILKFSFQVIQAFNDIRNNKSFAHDNPILNYDESVLIFSNVSSTVKFIQGIEAKHANIAVVDAQTDWGQF